MPIILVLALVLTACVMLFDTTAFTAHASSLQADRDLSADFTIYSTATLADDFEDNLVVVVLSREASRNFGEFTPSDFPEVRFRSVECITPGLDLAVAQTTASISSRANNFYYDSSWTVDLNDFRRILVLELYETGRQNVLDAIRVIERRADIHSAEPSWNTPAENIPGALWGYERILAEETRGFTRGRHTLGTSNVVVGVISLGIDSGHPYFGGRIYQRLSRCFTEDGHGAMTDRNGHGTGIAGIIGGQGERFTGIAPGVRMASLRVESRDSAGFYNSTFTERAVRHAITHNIRVLNVSSAPPRNHVATRTAIRQYPGLMVVSAGNTGHNVNTRYPLLVSDPLPNLIVTGAINNANQRAIWGGGQSSNYGTAVCIFAPGDNNRTTAIGGGVRGFGGTSGAAPHIVGTAALMLSTNFQLTGTQMRNAILNNAEIIPINTPTLGNMNVRRLNTHRAVASVALLTSNIGTTDLSITGVRDASAMPQNASVVLPERIAPFGLAVSPIGTNVQRNVTQIGASAFANVTFLSTITLPSTITHIGGQAFAGWRPGQTIIVESSDLLGRNFEVGWSGQSRSWYIPEIPRIFFGISEATLVHSSQLRSRNGWETDFRAVAAENGIGINGIPIVRGIILNTGDSMRIFVSAGMGTRVFRLWINDNLIVDSFVPQQDWWGTLNGGTNALFLVEDSGGMF